ncbi:AAA family ATPase [Isoptericola croceus]|uniref:AAA family ATPase n=1 Tax=Isoptericola croceus TaxID=3031406 RepID=UPI0023FA0F3C|nr:AAA family ATPase [Isoptericola croceus]
MSTSDRAALICLPQLADVLRAHGLDIVGGSDDFRADANATREALSSGPLTIIAADAPAPGMRAWLTKHATARTPVTLVRVADGSGVEIPGADQVALPTQVDELLATAELAMLGGAVGAATISADGSLDVPAPGPSTAPASDPWATEPTAPATAPAQPAIAAPPASDPWDDQPAPAPPAPAPAASADPWASPSPYLPEDLAPTPPPAHTSTPGQHAAAPVRPEPAAPAAPAPAVVHDEPIDTGAMFTTAATTRRPAAGQVAITVAGKGGVGKSSFAVAIAAKAASAGLRAVVIDANRGQGDQWKYLRVPASQSVPSIYDAAVGHISYDDLILTPDRLNPVRPAIADPLTFSVVLAPPEHLSDPDVVTTDVYAQAVQAARAAYDLVVIDTQIVEATDTSGLIDGLVVPLLRSGAWAVGISDTSKPGIDNLISRFKAFRAAGVDPDRMLVTFNRIGADLAVDPAQLRALFSGIGSYAGHVTEDTRVMAAMNSGQSPAEIPTLSGVLDHICFAVTGHTDFDPDRVIPEPEPRGLLARLRRLGR